MSSVAENDLPPATISPRRRLWQKCLIGAGVFLFGGATIVFLCVGYFFYDHFSKMRKLEADIQVIYDLNEPVGGEEFDEFYSIPEGETDNTEAVVAALELFAGLENGADAELLKELSNLPQNLPPSRPKEWLRLEAASELVNTHAEKLQALCDALASPGAVRFPTDYSRGLVQAMKTPYLLQFRSAVRLLVIQTLCQYHRREFDKAANSMIALVRLGEILRLEPLAISQLMRWIAWDSASSTLLFLMTDSEFSAVNIDLIQAELAATNFDDANLRVALGERALLFEGFELAFNQLNWEELDPPKPLGGPVRRDRPVDTAACLRHFTLFVEASKVKMPERIAAIRIAAKQKQEDLDASGKRPAMQRYIVAHMLNQPLDIIFESSVKAEAKRRALVVVCGIERYRRAYGHPPLKLDDLVPQCMTEVPADPADSAPLRYVVRDSEYVVYSVGLDQIDDSGQVLVDSKGKSLDFGFVIRTQSKAVSDIGRD
jgi:hypothetical protein